MKPNLAARLLLLVGIVASLASILVPKSPAPLPATAPADQFSAERAREIVAAIAKEPHPIGSAANARVREELQARLRALGVEPQLQEATAVRNWRSQGLIAGRVTNVLVRLPGTAGAGGGKAVLLMAHYDSVPWGPGASDDAAGVATLIETLRALKSSPPVARDLIFLFTDAEEAGLLGAQAFVDQHPWAKDVGVVLNFEARGSEGPVFMFETSQGNEQLIATLAHSVSHPVAASYSGEIYRRMVNDTDFSPFRDQGYQGLNFAYIDHQSAYHFGQDTLERMSLVSLQHHGSYALALARAFGNGGELVPAATNAVYFNLLGARLVHYPGSWVMPLAVLAGLLTLGVLFVALRRRSVGPLGVVGGAVTWLLATGLFGYGAVLSMGLFFPSDYNFRIWGGNSSVSLTLLALTVVVLGLVVGLVRLLGRWVKAESLLAGGLLVWLALTVAMSLVAPGASSLFVWPLLAALPAARSAFGAEASTEVSRNQLLLAALPVVVASLLWASTLASIGVALGAGAVGLIAGVLVLLMALCCQALIWRRAARGGWQFSVGALIVGLVLLGAVRGASHHGPDNKDPGTFWFAQDLESGEARWMSLAAQPIPWTQPFFGASPERKPQPAYLGGTWPVLQAPAPQVAPPEATISLVRLDEAKRELRLAWAVSPDRLILSFREGGPARVLAIDEQTLPASSGGAAAQEFTYHAVPATGVKVELAVTGNEPVELEVVAQYYGFTRLPGLSVPPRPADSMPHQFPWTDSMIFRSRHMLTVAETAPATPAP